jgi:hypothetical protein
MPGSCPNQVRNTTEAGTVTTWIALPASTAGSAVRARTATSAPRTRGSFLSWGSRTPTVTKALANRQWPAHGPAFAATFLKASGTTVKARTIRCVTASRVKSCCWNQSGVARGGGAGVRRSVEMAVSSGAASQASAQGFVGVPMGDSGVVPGVSSSGISPSGTSPALTTRMSWANRSATRTSMATRVPASVISRAFSTGAMNSAGSPIALADSRYRGLKRDCSTAFRAVMAVVRVMAAT